MNELHKSPEETAEKCNHLEEQNKYLNLHLQELVKENNQLQCRNEDLKVTVKENKQLLGNYHSKPAI